MACASTISNGVAAGSGPWSSCTGCATTPTTGRTAPTACWTSSTSTPSTSEATGRASRPPAAISSGPWRPTSPPSWTPSAWIGSTSSACRSARAAPWPTPATTGGGSATWRSSTWGRRWRRWGPAASRPQCPPPPSGRSGLYANRYDRRLADITTKAAIPEISYLWDSLTRVQCPTLVLRGEHSPILDGEISARMVESLPDGRLYVFKDTGHSLPRLRPEEFAAALRGFLLDGALPAG